MWRLKAIGVWLLLARYGWRDAYWWHPVLRCASWAWWLSRHTHQPRVLSAWYDYWTLRAAYENGPHP